MDRSGSRRKFRSDSGSKSGAPAWMVTYGDLMSLLLVFFVMIVSFSTMEVQKFQAVIGSVKGALFPFSPSSLGMTLVETDVTKLSEDLLDYVAEEIQAAVREAELEQFIEVHQIGGGVKIVFSDPVLFDVGSDELKALAQPILDLVVKISLQLDVMELLVEGHTDDTPINTERFPSNWELSSARSLKVLKYFLDADYPPERLAAAGYGEYRPRVEVPQDASWEEKAPNRRVEILLNFKTLTGLGSYRKMSRNFDGWED